MIVKNQMNFSQALSERSEGTFQCVIKLFYEYSDPSHRLKHELLTEMLFEWRSQITSTTCR